LLIERVRLQQASLIVVTHDQRLAAKADRVLNLNDGGF
jgi:lipoprotein-releasing system ATP-binding protein